MIEISGGIIKVNTCSSDKLEPSMEGLQDPQDSSEASTSVGRAIFGRPSVATTPHTSRSSDEKLVEESSQNRRYLSAAVLLISWAQWLEGHKSIAEVRMATIRVWLPTLADAKCRSKLFG